MRSSTTSIGIDVGGTKIEIAALSDRGDFLYRHRIPTPRTGHPEKDYTDLLLAIETLIGNALTTLSLTKSQITVGLGTPGALNDKGLIKNANSVCMNDKPFLTDLQNRLSMPLRMANDANCLALSEATDGAGKEAEVVFGVILGTGVGGGWAVNGKVIQGINSIAGEWGHNPLPAPSEQFGELTPRACYCGRINCIETWLSGPALSIDYQHLSGQTKTAEAIAHDFLDSQSTEHPFAKHAMERYAIRLAKSLALVINIMDPAVIVLGGGLSKVDWLYQAVPTLWRQWVFSDTIHTQLRPPKFGDSSGVRGAAWLWNDKA